MMLNYIPYILDDADYIPYILDDADYIPLLPDLLSPSHAGQRY